MIKRLKKILQNLREYWHAKHIQYPEMDIVCLVQLREWLIEQIAIRTAQHKGAKQMRELLVVVTARILEVQNEAKNGGKNKKM